MLDNKPRKKLSLGKKTITTKRTVSSISDNLKNKIQAKKTNNNYDNLFKNASKKLIDLHEQRKIIIKQIKQIEQRLLFAKSEPLQEFLFELKTQDFDLLTKINSEISRT